MLISQNLPKKTDLASLKSDVHEINIDELKTRPADLSRLSDLVKDKIVIKDIYDELVEKVNAIQTTDAINFVKKTDCDTKIGEVDRKIPPNHDIYITTQESDEFT